MQTKLPTVFPNNDCIVFSSLVEKRVNFT